MRLQEIEKHSLQSVKTCISQERVKANTGRDNQILTLFEYELVVALEDEILACKRRKECINTDLRPLEWVFRQLPLIVVENHNSALDKH